MTFEMGESLIYSWMKHIQGCHLVQTNWKASRSWTLDCEDEIFELVSKAIEKKFIQNKRECNVQTLTKRVLKQFECDCLGVRIAEKGNEFLAAEVAFHTAGLHYTPSKSSCFADAEEFTAYKVIQKLFVIALSLRGYLRAKTARVIFATPKIIPSFCDGVMKKMDEFDKFWSENASDFKYSFEFVADGEFRDQILKPLEDKVENVADMSELFMRCIQLEKMFEDVDVDGLDEVQDEGMEDEAFERAHKHNLGCAKKALSMNWSDGLFGSLSKLYEACTSLGEDGKDPGGWLKMALREEFRRKNNLVDRPTMRSMKKDLKK